MPRIRYKRAIQRDMTFLAQMGYRPKESGTGELVSFEKRSHDGTVYEVQFQLIQFASASRWLSVLLFRRFSATPPDVTSVCTPLAMDLDNVLRGVYYLDIFPAGKMPWEFQDEPSLSLLLATIKVLLVDYGIKWLEDPASNMDWVKQSTSRH